MKVLITHRSLWVNKNASLAINEIAKTFHTEDADTDIVQVRNKDVRGGIACGYAPRLNNVCFVML